MKLPGSLSSIKRNSTLRKGFSHTDIILFKSHVHEATYYDGIHRVVLLSTYIYIKYVEESNRNRTVRSKFTEVPLCNSSINATLRTIQFQIKVLFSFTASPLQVGKNNMLRRPYNRSQASSCILPLQATASTVFRA